MRRLPKPARKGDGERPCRAERDRYICTATAGHDGPHVAHGMHWQPVAVWDGEGTASELPPVALDDDTEGNP